MFANFRKVAFFVVLFLFFPVVPVNEQRMNSDSIVELP
jgi:hypothetical protein